MDERHGISQSQSQPQSLQPESINLLTRILIDQQSPINNPTPSHTTNEPRPDDGCGVCCGKIGLLNPPTMPDAWRSLKRTISDWTGQIFYCVQSYWWWFPSTSSSTSSHSSRRSRRKAAAPTTTAAAAAANVANVPPPPPSVLAADKENVLVEWRDTTAGANKKRITTGGAGLSSCSSGSSGSATEDPAGWTAAVTGGRRYRKQQRSKVGGGGGTAASVRESRSADLASISSASGGGVGGQSGGVCDTIGEKDFERLVTLPPGMDAQEWMASHALALFHHVNALYGVVCEFCTKESCPVMNGPGNSHFQWIDDKNRKVKYPAPQYVDCVMSFAERTVRSEEMFPTKFGNYFPSNFELTLKKLSRLLYHVLAHLHAAHWDQLGQLGFGSQAAAVHWHLLAFSRQFQMLESKDAAGLDELTSNLRRLNVSTAAAAAAADEIGTACAARSAASAAVGAAGFEDNEEEHGTREPMDASSDANRQCSSQSPPDIITRLQETNAHYGL